MRVLCVVSAIAAVGAQVCSPFLTCQTCTSAAGCVWGSSSGCVAACLTTESCAGVAGQCPLAPPAAIYSSMATPYFSAQIYSAPAPIYSAPAPIYSAPAPIYRPASIYAPAAPIYTPAAPIYRPAAPIYTQPAPVYAAPAPIYTATATVVPYATPAATYVPAPVYATPYTPYVPAVPPVVPADAAQSLYVSNRNHATTSHSGTPNPVSANPTTPPDAVDCSKGRFVIGDDNFDRYCANYAPVPYVAAAPAIPYVATTVPYVSATTTYIPASGTVVYASG